MPTEEEKVVNGEEGDESEEEEEEEESEEEEDEENDSEFDDPSDYVDNVTDEGKPCPTTRLLQYDPCCVLDPPVGITLCPVTLKYHPLSSVL